MSTELATVEPAPAPTIWGTSNPAAVVEQAQRTAAVLKDVLEAQRLVIRVSGKSYVLVEGWTLLGSMTGVFAQVTHTERTEDGLGWMAHVEAVTMGGQVVGAADAMCTRAEERWRSRDDFQLRSMAQTRAISKALRVPLGFIVELAGYSATPAEEMDTGPAVEEPAGPTPTRLGVQRATGALRAQIEQAAQERKLDQTSLLQIAEEVGVRERATLPQLRKILAAIEALPIPDEEESTDAPYP